jgi:hypothetical protein
MFPSFIMLQIAQMGPTDIASCACGPTLKIIKKTIVRCGEQQQGNTGIFVRTEFSLIMGKLARAVP